MSTTTHHIITPCLPSYMVKLFLETCTENFVVMYVKKDGTIRIMNCRKLGHHQQPWTYWNASSQKYVQSWTSYTINSWHNGKDNCVVSMIPCEHRGEKVQGHYNGYTSKCGEWTSEIGGLRCFNIHKVISINTEKAWTEGNLNLLREQHLKQHPHTRVGWF